MKSQITKIVSLLVCVCLIVSGMILSTSAANGTTYAFSSYPAGTQYANETLALDSNVSVSTYNERCHFNNQLRIYGATQGGAAAGWAVISTASDITALSMKVGYKVTTVKIATSADGTTWSADSNLSITSTSYNDYVVTVPSGTKYVKVTATDQQIRIESITVALAGVVTPPPASNDPADGSTLTIPEALALGETKDHNTYTSGKYYVEGVISSVSNETFGNMTIKDANNNSLTIYGSYDADGTNRYDAMATKPVAGDTVKLYGIIGKYSTTVQMKNAWIVAHTPGTPPVNNDPPADSTLTIPQALEVGGTKEHNTYTSGKYYVEGVISSVSNEEYGNMTIKDANNNALTIYGSYDADGTNRYDAMATKPVAGDTVKLYGIIGKYSTTVQMKNAWIVAHTPGTPPVNNDPAADTVLTVKAAAELGASKDPNAYTTGKYYVTGTIKSIASDVYGNMTIEDADGNELYVYGTWNEDGSVRYDALTDQPQVGDTVTVYGIIGQYNGTAQMKNGWFKAAPAGGNTGAGTGTGTGTGSTTGSNTNTNTGSTTTTAPEKSPETGDSIALYIVMMAISAAAMVLVAKKRFA